MNKSQLWEVKAGLIGSTLLVIVLTGFFAQDALGYSQAELKRFVEAKQAGKTYEMETMFLPFTPAALPGNQTVANLMVYGIIASVALSLITVVVFVAGKDLVMSKPDHKAKFSTGWEEQS